ncbi:hypothetical protein [Bosea sp. PAMC 26642]|uniref:hypothetical protein n=1 Tax=Bosea sp. (strain PAMC 26642) TaxID=1792307 RepID=UPI0012E879FD|nr:hypothetical protein [Bosea sp. PAMC 26642]
MAGETQADHFEKWVRYLRETRAAAEPWEKYAIEYQKFSVEYSKLLVTNLYVLNAGGLISLPALSSFLGVSTLAKDERMLILGLTATGFAVGLVSAALCSLFVYFNFQKHAELARIMAERDKYNVGIMLGIIGNDKDERAKVEAELADGITNLGRRVNGTFRAAHASGWLSLATFLASAGWLATNLR